MEGTFRDLAEPGLKVIETLRWEGELVRVERHMARAARTCAGLGYPFDASAARAALEAAACAPVARMRLTVDAAGGLDVACVPMDGAAPEVMRVALHPVWLEASDPYLPIKTTHRALYDQALKARPEGVDEWLFANAQGVLCEGSFMNVFARLRGEGDVLTSPVSAGLLPGVLREEMLETGRCREAEIRLDDLAEAEVWVGNSLRGLIRAELVEATPLAV